MELADRLGDPVCREFAEIYGRGIYQDRPLSREEIAQLKRLLAELERRDSP